VRSALTTGTFEGTTHDGVTLDDRNGRWCAARCFSFRLHLPSPRNRAPPAGAMPGHARAVYYALWTFGLWVIFGSYVLILWLIGAIFYAVFKSFR